MQFVNLVSDSIRLEHVMWQVMWSFSLRHQEAIRLEFAKGANKQDAMALYESWFCLIVLIFFEHWLKPCELKITHSISLDRSCLFGIPE